MKHDWEYKKLGDICDKGSSNISLNKIEDNIGEYALFGASGYVKDIDFYHNETPYIGIVKDGSGCGRVNIYPAKSSLVGTMQYIYPKQNCDIKFLMYLLQSLDLSSLVTGAAIPHIYFKDYSKFSVPVPPLSTQQSIVSELDSLSKIIADCKETLKDYDALEQSIFYDMFGDPVKNEKGWEVKKLGDCCSELKYGTSRPACENGQYKYLRMGNLTLDGHLDLTDLKTIDIPDDEIDKCIVKYGDILFNRTNSMELIGKTCMFDLEEPMVIAGYIIRVRLLDTLNPRFLSIMFNLPSLKLRLKSMAKGAVNQANINSKELASIRVILPHLPLQQTFASKIEAIEQMKEETKKALQEAETLFNARMDYWFN